MSNTIKKISLLVIALLIMSIKGFAQDDHSMHSEEMSDEPKGMKMEDGILYGKDYDPSITIVEFSDLMKNPSENDGKVIIVKGTVSEVCQQMGCWMTMSEGENTTRVLTDHAFLLPKDIAGRNAVVIGKFKVTEMSEEEVRHYNEESKNPKNSAEIKGPQKTFVIEASGIKILN